MTVNRHRVGRGPIFLTGTGRCGTTIIYHLLAMHPDVAWIPSWVNVLPDFPAIALVNRLWDLPGTDRFRETRFMPKPVESMRLFSHCLREYASEGLNDDLIREGRELLSPVLERIKKAHDRDRFVGKLVGRPVKVALLAEVFPDARFIHITRQLKPTVSSIMKVDFYGGWGSLDDWKWDDIPSEYLEYFEARGRPEEVGVAITVELNLVELRRQFDHVDSSRWMELPYADFVASPVESLRHIGEENGLRMPEAYLARVATRQIYGGADEKWRRYFSEEQIANLAGFEALVDRVGASTRGN